MSANRAGIALVAVVLQACGGGGDSDPQPLVERELTFSSATPQATGEASLVLSGTAFVVREASCEWVYNNPLLPPVACHCTSAPANLTWTNETTGATGSGSFLVSPGSAFNTGCFPRHSTWTAFSVPLAQGTNRITVSLTDGESIGAASVTVTRN